MNARSFLFLAILSLLAASSCPAQEAQELSDALNLMLLHSETVVAATSVKTEVGPRFGALCVVESFKDVTTLAGVPMDATLDVQFERDLRDDPTPFKPGQRFILFLKRRRPTMVVWELTDPLLGCQPYTKGLEYCASAAAKFLATKYREPPDHAP